MISVKVNYSTRWVEIPVDGDDPNPRYKVQYLPPTLAEKFFDDCSIVQKGDKEPSFDLELYSRKIINHIIVDWQNIKEKCTPANRWHLVINDPETSEWLVKKCRDRAFFSPDEDVILKKLDGSSDSSDNGTNQKVEISLE